MDACNMKTALLGLSNNVSSNIEKIKTWNNSFKKYCDGEVILLCANSSEEDLKACESLGIKPVPVTVKDTWYINHDRLKHNYEYLLQSDIDLFIVTDVFDVAFQGNPFTKLDTSNYDLFVSGEGVRVGQEPWNSSNINSIFPQHFEKCKPVEIINSGIIAGKREALVKLFKEMYDLCESGLNHHNIKDQAALIVMVANNQIEKLKIFNLDDGWAMHCAVAGPTQFFEGWGFKSLLMYGIPYIQNGFIFTKQGQKYDIVHQFNRIPEWHEAIKNNI